MRTSDLPMRCIKEAAAERIALEEIQPDSGTLESYISEAMLHLDEPGTPGD